MSILLVFYIPYTDKDGDVIGDLLESSGVILANDMCIESDPLNPNTNGDGLTDLDQYDIFCEMHSVAMVQYVSYNLYGSGIGILKVVALQLTFSF